VVGLLFMLGAAAGLMYYLLPQLTQPGQQVVPPLPASASNPLQSFLTIFIVMTTVGAPVTMAIVLALVLRWVSKQVPASSTAAEAGAKPAAKAAKSAIKPAADQTVKPLSAREETYWKIAATGLTLLIAGGVMAAVWPEVARLFSR
jgi:hypothetical protein